MLSLAIAIAGWAYLRLTPNPVIAAHFVQTLTVPISTTGLPGDEVARVADKQAVVVIDVPRSGVAVEPREVRAVLDLSGRGPGFYNVPLAVIAPKFSIKSLSPASVTLDVERIEERTVPVALHYSGNLHGSVVVSDARIQPATATLRAPTSDLANVASVLGAGGQRHGPARSPGKDQGTDSPGQRAGASHLRRRHRGPARYRGASR